jgi:ABC-type transport system involved in multi-copper enzyme maturation permease subunit
MNRALIARLILKDWYLSRLLLVLIGAAGTLSIGLLYLRREDTGTIGLISALIASVLLSILLPMQTVVNERKQHNLAFVISLPISPMEYTAAKVVGNLSAFLVLWAAIAIGVLGTLARTGIFGGLIPFGMVVALAPFVVFCLLLAVAIVVESEMWAVLTMGATNVSYSFWFLLMKIPGLPEQLKSPVAIWSRPILWILAGQITVIVVALGLTFYLQSRKRDFV